MADPPRFWNHAKLIPRAVTFSFPSSLDKDDVLLAHLGSWPHSLACKASKFPCGREDLLDVMLICVLSIQRKPNNGCNKIIDTFSFLIKYFALQVVIAMMMIIRCGVLFLDQTYARLWENNSYVWMRFSHCAMDFERFWTLICKLWRNFPRQKSIRRKWHYKTVLYIVLDSSPSTPPSPAKSSMNNAN